MRLSPALLALVAGAGLALLAACQSDPAPVAATDTPGADASNPAASTDSIPTDAIRTDTSSVDFDQPVRLVALENGDRACYLTVQADGEPERTDLAEFGLCERTDLVGQRVALTVTPSRIMAESCQGDPECRATEPVNLVTGMDPAEIAMPPGTPDI
jgi:hypothetical protein